MLAFIISTSLLFGDIIATIRNFLLKQTWAIDWLFLNQVKLIFKTLLNNDIGFTIYKGNKILEWFTYQYIKKTIKTINT